MASFIILKDIIEDGEAEGFMHGNENYIKDGKCKHTFRLLDADDEVYFEGKSGNSSSFEPLDLFGSGYGCTDIQYLENGKWETL
jgi:hypothetical protein